MAIRTPSGFSTQIRQPGQRPGTFMVLAALLLISGMTVPANAQEGMNCNTGEDMTNALAREYAEQPAGLGVTNAGTVVELWQGDGGSCWTLLLTMPNGNSCIVGAGSDWIQLETARKGDVSWKARAPGTR